MHPEMKHATFKVALDATNGEDAGRFAAILSAPTVDRDGEVVAAKAFDPLPDVLPIHRDHDMTTRGLCAVATPFYDGDLLKAKGEFFEDADGQRMRLYAKHGILRMSVGFMSAKREVRGGVPHVVKGELLEASFVTVPSNREAVITGVKSGQRAGVVEKAVAGSYEALRDDLQAALRSAGIDGYVRATFADSVVYEAYDDNYQRVTYQASYSLGEGGLTLGTPELITISEVIAPRKSPTTPPASKVPAESDENASPEFWAKALKELSIPTPTMQGATR